MARIPIEQHMPLENLIRTSMSLIQDGLTKVQRISDGSELPAGALESLSRGFELLAKVVISLHEFDKTGAFPTSESFRKYGHSLERSLARVLEIYDDIDGPSAIVEDREFLKKDEFLSRLVWILSSFGGGGRYYDLDSLASPLAHDSPMDLWSLLEGDALREHPTEYRLIGTPQSRTSFEVVAKDLVVIIERLARALSRLCSMGFVGPEAKRFSGYMSPFV